MAWIDELLKKAVVSSASDLHLSSNRKPLMRVHGLMTALDMPELSSATMEEHLREVAPDDRWKEFKEHHDTDFTYSVSGLGRFRFNYFVDECGPAAAIRIQPNNIPSIKDLQMPHAVEELCNLKKGLVLVTGATGSGKTTTMAAMLNHINMTRSEHIITIEDPIEYRYPQGKSLIHQREVHRHTDSFKSALRSALREDPNVVLVGELRDLETIQMALETAETGHLVLSTLHTMSAAGTVDRLIEVFPSEEQNRVRSLLGSVLKGVISQTLCRAQKGGRMAVYEVLLVNQAVAVNIREGKTMQIPNAMEMAKAQGMCLLNDSLIECVRRDWVDAREAYRASSDPKAFLARLSDIGIHLDPDKLNS